MSDELLAQYKKLTGDVATLEAAIVTTKAKRAEIAKALFEANGKSHVYEIDGVAMVITTSSTGTRYFTPKDKWAASGKPKKVKEPKAPKAPKEPKPKKVKVKKAIVGGRVVEVSAHLTAKGSVGEPPAGTQVVEASHTTAEVAILTQAKLEATAAIVESEGERARELMDAKPHTMTRGHVTPENPKAPVQVNPTPEPEKELDPVEAALAAIEGLDV